MVKVVLASVEYMKKPMPTPVIYKTLLTLPNVLLVCVLESPFFIAVKQMPKKLKQRLTMGHWHTNNRTMYSIPWKAHKFRTVNHNTVRFQTITSDASNYSEFSFRTGKFVQKDKTRSFSLVETSRFNYKQGQCVYVKYDDQCHLGVVQNLNHIEYLVNAKCLIKTPQWQLVDTLARD